jgi:hypothetical protein
MKLSRITFFALLFFVFWVTSPISLNAQQIQLRSNSFHLYAADYQVLDFFKFTVPAGNISYHIYIPETIDSKPVKRPVDGGIREEIPTRLKAKYQKWKDELLSTEAGRQQWENYSNNKQFILTITVASKEGQGAGTGKYQWDETGQLVGATITLGNKLDSGLPDAIYFPVMNSLSSEEPKYKISGSLLAAAKFAHEFGHVNQTAKMNKDLFLLQNKLMLVYNEILLKNGYNTQDSNLLELTKEMGGTPVEIWENREYWGEANAMLYLIDRINRENFYCTVLNKIKRNIETYAKNYEERFDKIEETKNVDLKCRK